MQNWSTTDVITRYWNLSMNTMITDEFPMIFPLWKVSLTSFSLSDNNYPIYNTRIVIYFSITWYNSNLYMTYWYHINKPQRTYCIYHYTETPISVFLFETPSCVIYSRGRMPGWGKRKVAGQEGKIVVTTAQTMGRREEKGVTKVYVA